MKFCSGSGAEAIRSTIASALAAPAPSAPKPRVKAPRPPAIPRSSPSPRPALAVSPILGAATLAAARGLPESSLVNLIAQAGLNLRPLEAKQRFVAWLETAPAFANWLAAWKEWIRSEVRGQRSEVSHPDARSVVECGAAAPLSPEAHASEVHPPTECAQFSPKAPEHRRTPKPDGVSQPGDAPASSLRPIPVARSGESTRIPMPVWPPRDFRAAPEPVAAPPKPEPATIIPVNFQAEPESEPVDVILPVARMTWRERILQRHAQLVDA